MTVDIVDLEGVGFARGELYGRMRHREIKRFLLEWLESLREVGLGEPRSYVAAMLRDTAFGPAIEQHPPDLAEEVRGVALGAKVPFDLLFASQLMDEEWAYRSRFLKSAEAPPKCSSVAVHPRLGLTWIGQTMDLGEYTEGHQVVVRSTSEGASPGALIFTVDSMIGLLGVNSRGVAVCVNALPQLPAILKGLPVAFVLRKLLSAADLPAAVEILRAIPHATGQHYLIATASGVRSFEASPAELVEMRSSDPSRVLHTNHPLAGAPATTSAHPLNSEVRLQSLASRLLEGEPDLASIKAALSSCDDSEHPVSRAIGATRRGQGQGLTSFTTGSMVSELAEGSPLIDSWIAAGPPHMRPYLPVQLRRD